MSWKIKRILQISHKFSGSGGVLCMRFGAFSDLSDLSDLSDCLSKQTASTTNYGAVAVWLRMTILLKNENLTKSLFENQKIFCSKDGEIPTFWKIMGYLWRFNVFLTAIINFLIIFLFVRGKSILYSFVVNSCAGFQGNGTLCRRAALQDLYRNDFPGSRSWGSKKSPDPCSDQRMGIHRISCFVPVIPENCHNCSFLSFRSLE